MKKTLKIHFLGIGGISQSAIALIFKSQGHFVSGSDRTRNEQVIALEKKGVEVCVNGVSEHIKDADLIIVSAAISEDDKELMVARSLDKKIISRAEALGRLASTYKHVISVAGSHGKTTTTAILAQIFMCANKNPTIHVGGNVGFLGGNVHVGAKEFFITEACEYVDSFLHLKSDVSVILNIQSDHLDYFKTFDNLNKSFGKFASHTKPGGLIVYLGDDNNANKHYKERSISFSMAGKGIVIAKNIKEYEKGKYKFDLYVLNQKLCKIKLGAYGEHNINNALAAICVALNYGIDLEIIKQALYQFSGVKRRFEDYGTKKGVKLIHDYAHHPTEIKATITLAKRVTTGRLFIVFQPHTYSRTRLLLEEFKKCFDEAFEILVYKVYPAREEPSAGINERELARQISLYGKNAFSFDDYLEMLSYLQSKLLEGDTVLILGAGDIESFASFAKTNL